MTTSATTPIRTISEKPMSNMRFACCVRRAAGLRAGGRRQVRRGGAPMRSDLVLRRLALDRGADVLRRDFRRLLRRRRFVLGALHAFLEALHRATQVL